MSSAPVGPEPQSEGSTDSAATTPPTDVTSHQEFTHFDAFIPVKYELPLDLQAAVVAQGESISNWLGPVNTLGGSDISSHYTRSGWSRRSITEVDRDALNTLLFTNNQIIGLMLGPDDMQNLKSGSLTAAGNQLVARWMWSRDSGRSKGMQFGSLNAKHWTDMVDALSAQPLEAALSNRLNCGLPYDRVQAVEVKSRFINPGVTIRLTDGSYLWYGTYGKRDRLAEVATSLRSYVKVK
jgi:hypothetical protein